MKIKNAVVTGATGGVGVNLINELTANGVSVTAVCRPDSTRRGDIPALPSVTVVECPLDNYRRLPQLCGPADAFFHLAWDGTYGESRLDRERQLNNAAFAIDAVRAAKKLGCSVFVGAGSQAEFGPTDGIMSPELECHPVTAYGEGKLLAGVQSRELCKELGIRGVWCRILSMYGPHDAPHTMVMSLIKTLLRGESPACTAGEQIWDYLYAKDAARTFYLAAQNGRDGAVYCVASGQTRRLSDFISAIRDAVDPDIPIRFGAVPYYPNQVMRMQADISALQHDTGFSPRYRFEDGIRETIQWVKENAIK